MTDPVRVVVLCAALAFAACAGAPPHAPRPDRTAAPAAAAAPAPVEPALEQSPEEMHALGEQLFQERCATCHEDGRAPPRSQIATNTPEEILDALTTGFMAPISLFMTPHQKLTVARHLSSAGTD